jgi:hypothetical protein
MPEKLIGFIFSLIEKTMESECAEWGVADPDENKMDTCQTYEKRSRCLAE